MKAETYPQNLSEHEQKCVRILENMQREIESVLRATKESNRLAYCSGRSLAGSALELCIAESKVVM